MRLALMPRFKAIFACLMSISLNPSHGQGSAELVQWLVEDEGGRTAHPAVDRNSQPIRSLGTREPFGEGRTYGRGTPEGFVILRVMETIPSHWENLTDPDHFPPSY